jgi:hypothetical protein
MNLNADFNGLTGRVNLIAWPNTSSEVVPDVQAIWELSCANRDAILGYKLLTANALSVATDSLGYSCEAGEKFVESARHNHTATKPPDKIPPGPKLEC